MHTVTVITSPESRPVHIARIARLRRRFKTAEAVERVLAELIYGPAPDGLSFERIGGARG